MLPESGSRVSNECSVLPILTWYCLGMVGITGKGVNVVILDDGLDYKSKDLADNFVGVLYVWYGSDADALVW